MGFSRFSRKANILAASFLATAFVITGGFAVQGYREAAAYRHLLQNGYQHAFSELTTNLAELDVALQKSAYATSPAMLSMLCTELFGKAMSAQMAIGELPYGNVELEQTAAFVAKVGDYAVVLSKNAAANGGCSDEERAALRSFSSNASTLSALLLELQAEIRSGGVTLEDLERAEGRLSSGEEREVLAGGSFQSIEADFPEVPSLIYDGPFSQHIAGRSAKMLADRPQVTQEEAKQAAAKFMDLKPEIFTLISSGEGRIPTFGFSAAVDGGELYIEVTRQGGLVVSLMNSRTVGSAAISREEALQTATAFLVRRGYPNLLPTYSIDQGNILTMNFAATQGDVICYPDLVKLSIALDTGRVVGFESAGYLMNHCERQLLPPLVSLANAQARVSPDLKIISHSLALIPTGGENEVFCHEFKCETADQKHYIVYLNGQTGNEEKLLILIEDENGTLTI